MQRFSLWLLVALCLALLAACGNTNTGGAGTAGTSAATPADASGSAAQTETVGATTADTTAAGTTETSMAGTTETAAGMTETAAGTTETAAGATDTATAGTSETTTAGATDTATAAATEGATATSGAAAGPLPNLNGRRVVVGNDPTYPPMEKDDEQTNQIVGLDPDLMNEIAKLINIKPEFKTANFDTIFTALQKKEYDAVMSSVSVTEERKKIVAFSDPYLTVGQIVVINTSNTKIKGYQDLASGEVTVGAQTGTTGETAALEKAKVPDNKLKRYQTIDLAFADLANGSIDAVVADSPTVANYTSQPQYSGKLAPVGEPFTTEDYAIAVNQSDTELLNAINAALKQIKSGNTIQQLKDKYKVK
jgi:polar amino acid transport system substrate-binding protein